MRQLISDNSVIKIEARTIAPDEAEHIQYAAQILTAVRDARLDMVTADGERGYWLAKCVHAAEAKGLIGLYVNGGSPVGAAVIERSITLPGTALLLAASSMWSREDTEPVLRKVAIDEARAQGLILYELVRERRKLGDDEVAVGLDGLPAAVSEIVRTTRVIVA